MGRDEYRTDTEIDEYLWPLTGETSSIEWESVTEELRIRQRLAEIMAHVTETHLRPRLPHLGARANSAFSRSVTQSVIEGPEEGPPWVQTLKEPVPRVLREEWAKLAQRLHALNSSRRHSRQSSV